MPGTMPDQSRRRPSGTWNAGSLRLTVFPGPAAEFNSKTWWTDLTGEPAERSTFNSKRSLQQEVGTFHQKKLELRIQPMRIDWLFTPTESEQLESEGIATIGTFGESQVLFLELMRRHLLCFLCHALQVLCSLLSEQ